MPSGGSIHLAPPTLLAQQHARLAAESGTKLWALSEIQG